MIYGSAYFFMTNESKVACLLADNVICEGIFQVFLSCQTPDSWKDKLGQFLKS